MLQAHSAVLKAACDQAAGLPIRFARPEMSLIWPAVSLYRELASLYLLVEQHFDEEEVRTQSRVLSSRLSLLTGELRPRCYRH